jgi:hypothetical protein
MKKNLEAMKFPQAAVVFVVVGKVGREGLRGPGNTGAYTH